MTSRVYPEPPEHPHNIHKFVSMQHQSLVNIIHQKDSQNCKPVELMQPVELAFSPYSDDIAKLQINAKSNSDAVHCPCCPSFKQRTARPHGSSGESHLRMMQVVEFQDNKDYTYLIKE